MSNLSVIERTVPIAIVNLQGRLDALAAPELRASCRDLVASGTTRIVVNLRRLEFMDSAGLAALVAGRRLARDAGGDLKLGSPDDASVRRILRLTRFDRVFEIAPTAEAAADRFLETPWASR